MWAESFYPTHEASWAKGNFLQNVILCIFAGIGETSSSETVYVNSQTVVLNDKKRVNFL